MPSFGFKGFTTGSPVALSVAQGVNSAARTVDGWGQSMAQVDILTGTAPVVTAPAGIWFEAIDISGFEVPGGPGPGEIYDPSFHEITFFWSVRGAPLSDYTAPGNMPGAWRNANIAYGRKVALWFPQAGTYTIDLRAMDASGNLATAETTLTVASADSRYSGTKTICYSNDPAETWAEEKPGCLRATAMAQVNQILAAAATPPRLLFKRGQTVADLNVEVDTGRLGHVGTWGSGARPVLRPAPTEGAGIILWNDAAMTQFTLSDLDFRGTWDSATETGLSQKPFSWAAAPTRCVFMLWNCSFDGFERVDADVREGLGSQVLFGNCVITNWRNYGALFSTPDLTLGFVGTRIAQHVDALHGYIKTGSLNNNHGPLRVTRSKSVYLAACDIFSRTGWSGAPGNDRADQPALRLNAGGLRDSSYILDRVVCEGGYQVINMATQNSRTEENPGNYLIDRALLIATAKTFDVFIAAELGGTTIRNCYGYMPDAPRKSPTGWGAAVRIRADLPASGNLEAPMAVYSSSFVSALGASNDPGFSWLDASNDGFTNVTVENNLLHAPDHISAVTRDAPIALDDTIDGVSLRFKGVRYNFLPVTGTLDTDVAAGASFDIGYDAISRDTILLRDQGPTDQAYWQAIASSDTFHMLHIGGSTLYATTGGFAVTLGATAVSITNLTGAAWPAGTEWTLKLDRSSLIPPMDTSFGQAGQSVPLPRPASGSAAFETAGLGRTAFGDALGRDRSDPPSSGAFEPL